MNRYTYKTEKALNKINNTRPNMTKPYKSPIKKVLTTIKQLKKKSHY